VHKPLSRLPDQRPELVHQLRPINGHHPPALGSSAILHSLCRCSRAESSHQIAGWARFF
jgi:hypothetical protein